MEKELFTVSREQILEAHDASCSQWKRKIENWFPDAFKINMIVGNWYKAHINKNGGFILFLWSGKFGNYTQVGFDMNGEWKTNLGVHAYDEITHPTEEEIVSHLVTEYEKRGFKKGAKYKCVAFPDETHTVELDSPRFWNLERTDCTNINKYNITSYKEGGYGGIVYKQGKWAEIIEPVEDIPTQEEIDRVLNYLKLKAKD